MGLVFSTIIVAVFLLYIVITVFTAMFLYWFLRRYILKDEKMQWWQNAMLGVFSMLVSIPLVVMLSSFIT
jgi:hypothetical protein